MYPEITLKKKSLNFIRRKHPWVFSGAIHTEESIPEGEIVSLVDSNEKILATGHFHNGSIAVRILDFSDVKIDGDFYYHRIKQAWELRKTLNLAESSKTNAFRWVNGEGDLLPGLIIDVYNDIAVVQCHSTGMLRQYETIVSCILKIANSKIKHVFLSVNCDTSGVSGETKSGLVHGSETKTTIRENDYQFSVDVKNGQKTGFFLDQRENRKLLANFSAKMKVLNAFSYTGGFSIYAHRNKATEVTSIDISKEALELCRENSTLNGIPSNEHHIVKTEVKDFLSGKNEEYDLVILDPPAFAKSKRKRHSAIHAYKQLNKLGLKAVKKGGYLFTFSCSQVVNRKLFNDTIISASIETDRNVKIIHHLSQGPDHPVNIFHQEGFYLKGLVLKVD